jgi:tetratricopeptide (TPR) repeat protein
LESEIALPLAFFALVLALVRSAFAAEKAPEPPPAARLIAALEGRLEALRKEGTGLALRERYEAILADASAMVEAAAGVGTGGPPVPPPDKPTALALARAHWLIARCCEALGKHPEKEAAFERYIDALMAVAQDQAAAELRTEIEALIARRELFAATKLLRLMLAKFPAPTEPTAAKPDGAEAAWALYRLGACYLLMDHFADATTAFSEVLERWPDSPAAAQARLRIARASLAQRKAGESAAMLEAFLAQRPQAPQRDALLFDLAVARYLSHDYYSALVGFMRLVRDAPDSPYVPIARAAVAKLRTDILNRLSTADREREK